MLIRIAPTRFFLLALAAGAAQAAPSTLIVADASVGTSDLPVILAFPALRTGDLGYDIATHYRDAIDPWVASGTAHFTTLAQDAAANVLPLPIPPHTANDADANVYVTIDQAVGLGPMPSFSAPSSVAVGEGPRAIAVGDINRDGIADLAVAHGGSVSVLLGATLPGAVPSFSAPQDVALGLDLAALRLADVDGDGKLDLVATDAGTGSVVVRLGKTTTGSAALNFAAPSAFAAGAGPDALVLADMDGDGRPDAIVADRQDHGFSVLLNTTAPGATTPSFLAAQAFDLGGEPGSLVVADLDMHTYLVAALPQASAIVMRQLASATGETTLGFAAAETVAVPGSPADLVAMDVDNDGLVDFAASIGTADSIAVLFNRGKGGDGSHLFETRTVAVGPDPAALVAADLNGDGKPELLSSHAADASVSVVRNACTPDSHWSPLQRLASGSDPTAVVVADLNGDGRSDALALRRDAGEVAVFVNATPKSAALTASSASKA